jgi:DNA polymerase (family 10)
MTTRAIEVENSALGRVLREAADRLEAQAANPFRVAAYRRGADAVAAWPESLQTIYERQGIAGLEALPHVGKGIAAALAELLGTGHWRLLDQLRDGGEVGAALLAVPGIGPQLARRLHDELGVDTPEALEAAAHDGRLQQLHGIGPRRTAAIAAAVTTLLDRQRALRQAARRPAGGAAASQVAAPPVELLLAIAREYRDLAEADRLPRIAPRRFNPEGKAWLPVWHVRRSGWHFTALFSNTARAHELGRVRDWIVIYCADEGATERQYTVVTETRGALAGRRVVRGRETECRQWYASQALAPAAREAG